MSIRTILSIASTTARMKSACCSYLSQAFGQSGKMGLTRRIVESGYRSTSSANMTGRITGRGCNNFRVLGHTATVKHFVTDENLSQSA